MHPSVFGVLEPMLRQGALRSLVRRATAVLDALVAHCREAANIDQALAEVAPPPLALVRYRGADLHDWPSTKEGRELGAGCVEVVLCLCQLDTLRSVVAIVACAEEGYVVWLTARNEPGLHGNGFVDDAEAAGAAQTLHAELNRLMDLRWLEEV